MDKGVVAEQVKHCMPGMKSCDAKPLLCPVLILLQGTTHDAADRVSSCHAAALLKAARYLAPPADSTFIGPHTSICNKDSLSLGL